MLDYVKFEAGGFSFEYPGAWQIESQSDFEAVIQGPGALRVFFRADSIADHAQVALTEATVSALLLRMHAEPQSAVQGLRVTVGDLAGVSLQSRFVRDDAPFTAWLEVVRCARGTAHMRAALSVASPDSLLDAAEPVIRQILESFAVNGTRWTTLRQSPAAASAPFDPTENPFAQTTETAEIFDPSPTVSAEPPRTAENGAPPDISSLNRQAAAINPATFAVVTLTVSPGGSNDGPLALARFLRPNGIAVDPQGNLYVADFGGHRIRRISTDGNVTTLAGGAPGFRDEPGALAMFNGPRGVAYLSGFLYVADLGNFRIRRITLDGTVSTYAGDGTEGVRDGLNRQAQFSAPRALAADFAGNLFVADGSRIRHVMPNNMVQTIAGGDAGFQDGPARTAQFNTLSSIALDRDGTIYVTDAGNRALRRLRRDGVVSTVAGTPGGDRLLQPVAVTVAADGTVYVIDAEDFSVKCVFPDGSVARVAGAGRQGTRDGQGGDGPQAAEFWMPTGITAFKNRLYVTDRETHAIRLIRIPEPAESAPPNVSQSVQFDEPPRIGGSPVGRTLGAVVEAPAPATASGSKSALGQPPFAGRIVSVGVRAADYRAERLAGGVIGFRDGAADGVRFNNPIGLCATADGTVYVADHFNHCIRGLTSGGDTLTLAGAVDAGLRDGVGAEARFKGPLGLAVSPDGEVCVADHLNACIRVMTRAGEVRTLAGGGLAGLQDGHGRGAQFEGPKGLAVDAAGVIYVADGPVLRRITPDGHVFTLAGGRRGFRDGTGSEAAFAWPYAVALDADGNCFVADAANHAIRRVTPAGEVTTVYGGPHEGRLNFPSGVAVDAAGVIYIADTKNRRIVRLEPDDARREASATVICGGQELGTGSGERIAFEGPRGIAIGPHGELYVADSGAHRIIKVTPHATARIDTPQPGPTGVTRDEPEPPRSAPPTGATGAITSGFTPLDDREETGDKLTKTTETPPPVRQRVAAAILGWGIELTGNNVIRTEPDGALFLDTTYGPENSAFFFLPWEATAEKTVTVEFRMQLVAYVGERDTTGCAVWLENDRYADTLLIYPQGVQFMRAPHLFHPCDTQSEAHTYAVVMRGDDITLSIDGVPRIDGKGEFWERPAARAGVEPRRWLAFGDGSAAAGSAAKWHFVRYSLTDAPESAEPPASPPEKNEEDQEKP
jgi:sugar lactone lactonase YvrE